MDALPSTGMPFDIYEKIQRAQYGHPNVYANSENITPPVKKESIRVVEPSTRSSVNMSILREWQFQKDYWEGITKDIRLKEYLDQQYEINKLKAK